MAGEAIGPYDVLEKLGSGGMGDVYLALDTRLGRKVALKKPSEAWLSLPDARRRLHREASAAGGLTHPNIAAIYDVLDVGSTPYIVMEYVAGESLDCRLRRGPLPLPQVLDLGIQIADALATAHAQGVVHRDLKPGNISVTADGRAKILDFGLAKASRPIIASDGSGSTLTIPGQILGTPGYSSPEQLTGAAADPGDDIYSLGVLLFQLATGRRPFEASDALGLARATLTQSPPRASDVNPHVPDALSDTIARALAPDREARIPSASRLRAELQRVEHDLGAELTGELPAAPRRMAGRRGAIAAIVAVAVLTGTAAYLGRRWGSARTTVPAAVPVLAVLPFTNHSPKPGDESIAAGMRDVLIANLAGQPGLNVLSRSALAGPAADRDPRRAATSVGATFLLDASLQRAGSELIISVTLVPGDSRIVAWSDTFSAPEHDLAALQERISDGVSRAGPLAPAGGPAPRRVRAGTPDVQALAQYGQAVAFLERPDIAGNPLRAAELLRTALERDPKFVLAWARLGESYWACYQETFDPTWPKKATDAIDEALRLDRNQPRVWISLALVRHGTGNHAAAIDALNQALALQPDSDDAHRQLGEVLQETGRYDEAAAHYRKAIELRPNYWRNYSLLGGLHYGTGRHQEAIDAFKRVTDLQPDNARGFHNLGTVYYTLGQNDQALAQYQKAIAIGPMADTYSNIGIIHYDEGRYAAAVESFQHAVRLAPKDGVLHGNLGDAHARLGHTIEARRAYEQALTLDRELLKVNANDATTLARLAAREAKLGLRSEAERDIQRAVELAPTDADVLYRRAVVAALLGRTEAALAALEQALGRGYSGTLAARDHDLAPLRNSARFRELTSRH